MTDAEYLFRQDVKEKSITKKSARHKICGSKSSYVSLPSDYLSKKEKKKLSGECYSMKLNTPIRNWNVFKSFPETLQAEYINNLIKNYGARRCDIAEMFGVSTSTLYLTCTQYKTPVVFPRGGNRYADERFVKFLEDKVVENPAEVVEYDATAPKPVNDPKKLVLQYKPKDHAESVETTECGPFAIVSSFDIEGVATKEDICKVLNSMLDDEGKYTFTISIMRGDKNGE